MGFEGAIQRYRHGYATLLRLYPKPYYERFGEGMDQTFADLMRERAATKKSLLSFSLGVFLETFAGIMRENITFGLMKNKRLVALLAAATGVLALPAVGMLVSKDVQWSPFDFAIAGVLLYGAALAFEFIAQKGNSAAYTAAVALGGITTLGLIWVNLAVGFIGSEDNPANAMYLAVLIVGLLGMIITRLEARGMTKVLFTAAGIQMLVPVVALMVWPNDFSPGVVQVFFLNAVFATFWTASGLLFQQAGEKKA
jgi:hypothetical protein